MSLKTQLKIMRTGPGLNREQVRHLFQQLRGSEQDFAAASRPPAGGPAVETANRVSGWAAVSSLAFSDQVSPTVEAAQDYLSEETNDNGPAVAIAVRELGGPRGAAIEQLVWQDEKARAQLDAANEANDRLSEAVSFIRRLGSQLVSEFLQSRRGFADCPCCDSRLAKAYLDTAQCPLCASSLLPGPAQIELDKAHKKAREADRRFRRARSSMNREAAAVRERLLGRARDEEIFWLIGAQLPLAGPAGGEKEELR